MKGIRKIVGASDDAADGTAALERRRRRIQAEATRLENDPRSFALLKDELSEIISELERKRDEVAEALELASASQAASLAYLGLGRTNITPRRRAIRLKEAGHGHNVQRH